MLRKSAQGAVVRRVLYIHVNSRNKEDNINQYRITYMLESREYNNTTYYYKIRVYSYL
jgi:hypothetical protein